jgi:hypothetical protein
MRLPCDIALDTRHKVPLAFRLMKVVLLITVCLLYGGLAWAGDSTNEYYIERYPGDGMKQRPKSVPSKKVGDGFLKNVLPERGESSSTDEVQTVSTNSAPTHAARYISPRVSSKEFAPTRKPEGKMKTVVITERKEKLPPSPKVSDKIGLDAVKVEPKNDSSTTNQPAEKAESPK